MLPSPGSFLFPPSPTFLLAAKGDEKVHHECLGTRQEEFFS